MLARKNARRLEKMVGRPNNGETGTSAATPVKIAILGGGPAGVTAAIYAARAGLKPLLIAPAMGGQLMSKGVNVENYPGLEGESGGDIIKKMKKQARPALSPTVFPHAAATLCAASRWTPSPSTPLPPPPAPPFTARRPFHRR